MGAKGIAAALAAAWCAGVLAEGAQPSVVVYYPGVPWQMRYDLDDVVEDYNSHKRGLSTYATARSQTSGLLVSAQLNADQGARSAAQCREREHQHIRNHKAFARSKIALSDANGVDLEVVVPLGQGADAAVSRHVHRFWLRDGVCAKVHASKTPFREEHRAAFDTLLRTVRFEPATPIVERAFVVPGRGTLVVPVPAAWGFRARKPEQMQPRDVEFMDSQSDAKLLLTIAPDARPALKGDPTTRKLVESARDAAKPGAAETDLPLVELKGRGGSGWYFLATDRNLVDKPPRPEDWKYLRQGALLMGESVVFFSMFSNEKDGAAPDAGLRALSGARVAP
jgi:hypothetical protein